MISKLKIAKEFAKKKHSSQKRKDGKTPYWKHLETVVNNLEILGVKDIDVLCAGWLHDTIEDTSTDYDDIYEKCGRTTADIVAFCTKDTRLIKNQREIDYIKQLRTANLYAKTVKLCDVLANISDLKNSNYSKSKMTHQVREKIPYLVAIKPTIIKNKKKFSGFTIIQNRLNGLLEEYENSFRF